jgi:hypothetical protein
MSYPQPIYYGTPMATVQTTPNVTSVRYVERKGVSGARVAVTILLCLIVLGVLGGLVYYFVVVKPKQDIKKYIKKTEF